MMMAMILMMAIVMKRKITHIFTMFLMMIKMMMILIMSLKSLMW
jgi:hypothetical protein